MLTTSCWILTLIPATFIKSLGFKMFRKLSQSLKFFKKIQGRQCLLDYSIWILDSKRLVLAGDIWFRSCPNIGGTYGNTIHISLFSPRFFTFPIPLDLYLWSRYKRYYNWRNSLWRTVYYEKGGYSNRIVQVCLHRTVFRQ